MLILLLVLLTALPQIWSHRRVGWGAKAPALRYPYSSIVLITQKFTFTESFCSGTMITDLFVLTAGHCVKFHTLRGEIKSMTVGYGSLKRSSLKTVKAKNWILYPFFHGLFEDIGLVQVETVFIFTPNIKPALPSTWYIEDDAINTQEHPLLCGWGTNQYETISEDLECITYKNIDQKCNAIFPGSTCDW